MDKCRPSFVEIVQKKFPLPSSMTRKIARFSPRVLHVVDSRRKGRRKIWGTKPANVETSSNPVRGLFISKQNDTKCLLNGQQSKSIFSRTTFRSDRLFIRRFVFSWPVLSPIWGAVVISYECLCNRDRTKPHICTCLDLCTHTARLESPRDSRHGIRPVLPDIDYKTCTFSLLEWNRPIHVCSDSWHIYTEVRPWLPFVFCSE